MDSITEMMSIRANQHRYVKETIENDAYLHSCRCPQCSKKVHRDYEERTFYCENCGTQLHQRIFTQEEIDDALFQHEMDEQIPFKLSREEFEIATVECR